MAEPLNPSVPSDRPALRDLLRVVPIAQTVERNGIAITLLSLEVYDDGFLVYSLVSLPDTHPMVVESNRVHQAMVEALRRCRDTGAAPDTTALANLPHPQLMLAATDDQGNRYTAWFGGTLDQRSTHHFAPPLDPAARTVRFDAELRWHRHDAASRGVIDACAEPGTWTFVVDLSQGRASDFRVEP